MPEFDYSRAIATADRLVRRFGRNITLKAWSRTPANSARPWLGAAATTGAPPNEVPNVAELDLVGVFVPPGAVRIFNLTALGEATEMVDLIAFSEQIIITYPGQSDIRQYKTVNDGTADWGVTSIQVLKPANEQVLAFIGVRR